MDSEALLEVFRARGLAPNLAAGVAWRAGSTWSSALFGETTTRFDLASVTKSLFAAAVAGSGAKDRTLGALLPLGRGTTSEDASLELLLSHRAGLEAHLPLWLAEPFDRDRMIVEAANARRPDLGAPPFAPVYSDMGYLLAGEALARSLGTVDAGAVIEERIAAPLGVSDRLGTARSLAAMGTLLPVAPTEDVPFRGGIIAGEVHDENAWAFGGRGGCGHAGMFGTVDAVLAFGCAMLDAIDHLPNVLFAQMDDISWMVRPRPGGTLRAGFDGKSDAGSSAGASFGPNSFGHLGFTGTSFWIDPDAKIVAAFLTNRVCPTRDNAKIKEARPAMHDALHRLGTARRISRPR